MLIILDVANALKWAHGEKVEQDRRIEQFGGCGYYYGWITIAVVVSMIWYAGPKQ